MKQCIALCLALLVLLCGCTGTTPTESTAPTAETAAPTGETAAPTEPSTEPSTEPATEPPPVYTNPLNGQTLDAPFTGRIWAFSISNIPEALPHVSVNEADIFMEMFVNNSIIRCLALYTDISDVQAIGSIRSTRLMFNNIAQHYNAVLLHAAGSSKVLSDLAARPVDTINLDHWNSYEVGASYRDKEYHRYYEHSLFGNGPGITAWAEAKEIPLVTEAPDCGLVFTGDATPAQGETAEIIRIQFRFRNSTKDTAMVYDAAEGKYCFYQYGQLMTDQITGEAEAFRNVIIMNTAITTDGIYHVADFLSGGNGYYACGGKLIPITWSCADENAPFRFFTMDGQDLAISAGNTYIAIVPLQSPVTWEPADAGAAEEPANP